VSATALRKFSATRIDFVLFTNLITYLIFDFQFFSIKIHFLFFLLMYEYSEEDSL
jgi:hypothetical protein